MRPPISGVLKITQLFGGNPAAEAYASGGHLVLGHTGIDIGTPEGTSVYPAWPGTVEVIDGGNIGFGLHLVLHDDRGRTALYGHLSSVSVANGARVATHEEIAKSGSTGYSTGPHIHFQIQEASPDLDNGYLGCRDPLGGFDHDVQLDLTATNL